MRPHLLVILLTLCVLASPARAATLTLSPSPTRADIGGHIAFVAAGGSGTGYVFTLAAALSGGTITSAGEYTAGLHGGVTDVVNVVDSAGDGASANVDVISTLAIGGASSVPIGTAQSLTASGGSGSYMWSLSAAPSGGTITSAGAYTAGVHGDVTDVVVLGDGSGNQATLAIRVTSGLAIAPAAPHVTPRTQIGFVASGGSGGGYVFTLTTNASGATLDPLGVYVAGPIAGVTDVLALTDADGNTLTTPITVDAIAIAPSNATVLAGASRAFVASGGSGGGYVWSLATNVSGGSVNEFGIYTAGLLAGVTDLLRVQDATGNVSTARITVDGPRIAPTGASVAPLSRLGFVAEGGSGGYTWSFASNVSGGTINEFGIYVAGALAGVTDVVQVEDSRGNRSTVSVSVTGGPTIAPAASSIAISTSLGFVATGGSGRGYTWRLTRATTGASINDFGVYTAGPVAGTDIVEVEDSNGSRSTTTVTVTSGLAIAPTTPIVYQGTTFGFVARGGVGEGYRWSIGTNASGAAITALGVYTAGVTDAGANVTDSVRVEDGAGNMATMTITVLPPPPDVAQADGGLVVGASGEPPDDSGCGVSPRSSGGLGVLLAVFLLASRRRRR